MAVKVWSTAKAVLNAKGWHRATPAMEKALDRALGASDSGEPPCLHSLNTHPRSGEFGYMVDLGTAKVKEAAKRRKIWWCNDSEGEWTSVTLLFGTEKQILAKLESFRAEAEATNKARAFRGTITRDEVQEFGNRFGGEATEYINNFWYTRKDKKELHFRPTDKKTQHGMIRPLITTYRELEVYVVQLGPTNPHTGWPTRTELTVLHTKDEIEQCISWLHKRGKKEPAPIFA